MSELGQGLRKFGFGLMRLPKQGKEFDLEQIKKMVDRFLEEGFTYFDTAWVYTGSENAIRQALVERYPRESFQLATKLASWAGDKSLESSKTQFAQSLERTGAGYFDFYLLHNLGGDRTKLFDSLGIWDYVADLKAQGLIKHYGFSFHAQADELDKILTAHPET
ncbi:MAG: aldo/keto reductase [Victivallales bacterium]|nr:aldo/keto reductase [Victivallales bacterium]